jgi:CheY-like chemotaxis protein
MPNADNPTLRILVVEDDEAIRSTMCDILELNGYTVYQAGDGQAGVEAALAQAPDMILADIAMPRMDGLAMIGRAACRRAHPRDPDHHRLGLCRAGADARGHGPRG